MKKLLDISHNKEITLFTHHSIPLQIPIVNEKTIGWYMSCFLNIFYRYEYPQGFDYTDYKDFYNYIFDKDVFTSEYARTINTPIHFSSFIEQDKYIYAWVDQYYISSTQYFNCEHNIHPIMIYGYDDERDIYFCIGFSIRRSVYFLEVKRDEYHKALESAFGIRQYINDDDYFCLFKPRTKLRIKFVLERFINQLSDYICGQGSLNIAYFSNFEVFDEPDKYNHSAFGIEVTRAFCEILKNRHSEGRVFDYRVMHMICENKGLIYTRLQYLSKVFDLSEKAERIISNYGNISNDYNAVRMLSYKYALSENGGKRALDMINEKDHIESICEKMMHLYNKEKEILRELMPELLELEIKLRFPKYLLHKVNSTTGEVSEDFKKEKHIKAIVVSGNIKDNRGRLILNDYETDESFIDESSSHCFYVVHIDKLIKNYKYVSHQKGNVTLWLLEEKNNIGDS